MNDSRYFGDFRVSDETNGIRGARQAAEQRLPDRLLFIAVALLICGLEIVVPHEDPENGSLLEQSLLGCIYLAAFVGVALQRRTALPLLRASWPVVVFVLLAVVSTLWSDEPWTTARRSFLTLGSSTLALYFVCRLGLKGFVESLAIGMTIAAALSAVLIGFLPNLGVMHDVLYAGAWQGIFAQKNVLGTSMVLGMLTIAVAYEGSGGFRRVLWLAALVLMLVLLVGSRSATSAIAAITLAFAGPILLWSRSIRSVKPALIAVIIVWQAVLIGSTWGFNIDDAFAAVGRDATLTGRTELWQGVIDAIAERPILGYGYQAFFTTHSIGDWDASHAHNGFLQTALDLGIAGALALILVFALGIVRASVSFWRRRDRISAWPFFAVLYVLLTNLSEDTLYGGGISWIVLVAAFLFATESRAPESGVANSAR